jgi:hypothetical protein
MNTKSEFGRSLIASICSVVILAGIASCSASNVQPYESCASGDDCSGGLVCAETSLPASTGYTGSFCTSTCNADSDCLQVPSNYDANCVTGQCYLTCPSSDSCPDGQSCLTFQDQSGNSVSLCTP